MKQLTHSVIICTRNRPQDMQLCLQALAQQTMAPTQIVIVDSSDQPLKNQQQFNEQYTKTIFPYSELIYQHTKPGLTYQRNKGITLVTGDITHFLDDDSILEPNYIKAMDSSFKENSCHSGGMGSLLNVPEKQHSLHRFLRCLFLLQRDNSSGLFTWSGMPTHTYGTQTFRTVQVLGGCCMSYRTSVFKKHLFDEKLKRYGYMEDCDFSWRVSCDASLFYNPQAQLRHMASPLSRDTMLDNRAMFIKHYSYLYFKNFYSRNRCTIFAYWWSIVGLFVEALYMRNILYFKGYIKGLKQFYGEDWA